MKIAGRSIVVGAGLLLATTFVGGAVAGAQESDDAYVGAEPEVLGQVEFDAEVPSGATAAASTNADPSVEAASLAFTGGDVIALTALGGAAVAGGAVILTARRRSAA